MACISNNHAFGGALPNRQILRVAPPSSDPNASNVIFSDRHFRLSLFFALGWVVDFREKLVLRLNFNALRN